MTSPTAIGRWWATRSRLDRIVATVAAGTLGAVIGLWIGLQPPPYGEAEAQAACQTRVRQQLAPRVPVFGQITRREHQAGWTLT